MGEINSLLEWDKHTSKHAWWIEELGRIVNNVRFLNCSIIGEEPEDSAPESISRIKSRA